MTDLNIQEERERLAFYKTAVECATDFQEKGRAMLMAGIQQELVDALDEIADLQRLAERAYLILNDKWDALTDSEGYGPTSLLKDLDKARNGAQYRDMRKALDMQAKALREAIDERDRAIGHLRGTGGS